MFNTVMSLIGTIGTTVLEAPSVSVRFVTSCFVMGTSLLGAPLSSARVQLQTEIIFLLLQGGKNHKEVIPLEKWKETLRKVRQELSISRGLSFGWNFLPHRNSCHCRMHG